MARRRWMLMIISAFILVILLASLADARVRVIPRKAVHNPEYSIYWSKVVAGITTVSSSAGYRPSISSAPNPLFTDTIKSRPLLIQPPSGSQVASIVSTTIDTQSSSLSPVVSSTQQVQSFRTRAELQVTPTETTFKIPQVDARGRITTTSVTKVVLETTPVASFRTRQERLFGTGTTIIGTGRLGDTAVQILSGENQPRVVSRPVTGTAQSYVVKSSSGYRPSLSGELPKIQVFRTSITPVRVYRNLPQTDFYSNDLGTLSNEFIVDDSNPGAHHYSRAPPMLPDRRRADYSRTINNRIGFVT